MAFIPNENNYPMINHKDENKQNNRADNLEWCTAKYNMQYSNIFYLARKSCEKKVAQIDIASGEVIRVYNSISEAQRITKIRHICECARGTGRQKTAGGYKWKYFE